MHRIFLALSIIILSTHSYSNIFKKLSFDNLDLSVNYTLKGQKLNSVPGEPKLPFVQYHFLLPASADPSTVKISIDESVFSDLSQTYSINPCEAEIENGTCLLDEKYARKNEIYSRNTLFPENNIREFKTGAMRQFQILSVKLYPFQYNPITQKVRHLKSGILNISYNEDRPGNREDVRTPTSYIKQLKSIIENYDETINTYKIGQLRANENYTIITTKSIENGLNKLNAFINTKKTRGFDVDVITEEQWGGGSGDNSADNLREWLKNNYISNEISYLLIIGNPNPSSGDIAMKNAYAYFGGKIAHTDFYFSELTGNWDADGDGKFGETDDVKASGGIDAFSDIAVGRIPCYNGNYSTVDKILQKCIDYETEDDISASWRKNMLLAMDGYYGSEGPEVGEKIKDDIQSATSSWDFYRIYCRNYGSPEESRLTPSAVTNAWSSGTYGIVSWLTHGSETKAMNIFSTSYVPQLNDKYPSFVIMGSCLNGKPTNSGNLAYEVLKNGGAGVIAGSETTIYKQPMGNFVGSSYNHGLIHAITKNIAIDGTFIIDAFNNARHDADMGCWKNYVCYNLYGDPTLGIEVNGFEDQTNIDSPIQKNDGILNFKVYENFISINGLRGDSEIKIFNIAGRELYHQFIQTDELKIDREKLNVGNSVLYCKVLNNKQSSIYKFSLVK